MTTIPSTTISVFSYNGGNSIDVLAFPSLLSASGLVTITNNPLLTSIQFGASPVFASTTLTFSNNALDQPTMDSILALVDASGQSNGTLDLSGTSMAAYSDAIGMPSYNNLVSRGWNILTSYIVDGGGSVVLDANGQPIYL